ncbi:hypothetical protein EEB14_09305 [Rhodococcus sp. WS4]|nr:hypothetical protein EEB14_09305 [Rhodococcus sp. WS4]
MAIARALITDPKCWSWTNLSPRSTPKPGSNSKISPDSSLQRDRDVTVVLVTHDIDAAVYLSDRIVVLSRNPASVVEIIDVNLGTERDQIRTRETSRFSELRSHILAVIREVQLAASSR